MKIFTGRKYGFVSMQEIVEKTYGLVDGPFGSAVKKADYISDGIPVIRGVNLSLGKSRINLEKLVFISFELASKHSRALARPGDIVFTKKGTLGSVGILPPGKFDLFFISSNQMKATVNSAIADNRFVYYVFSSSEIRERLINEASITGVPKINLGYLKKFKIPLPPLHEQKGIAHVLGTLDDKIELNRRMNKTLEAMAQALFKSWFVDFDPVIDNAIRAGNPIPKDLEEKAERRRKVLARESYKVSKYADIFPDSFVDSELGSIPKSWDADFLDNIIEIISGGTPKRSESKYWDGEIPWFSVRDAPAGSELFVNRTKETISDDGLESCSANLVPSWTTIISARGTVGKLALTTQEMTFNQSCYGIRPSPGYGEKFIYFTIKNSVELLKKGAHGSVFDTITRKTFEVVRIIKPPTKNSEIFESYLEGILRTIKLNVENSNYLAGIRDVLLPKLITGEIRVPKSRAIK